ncbi:MAG: bifunctional FO biosynthesis protein CofGH [Candidatus Nanopelagicales bacterium]
MRTGETEEQVPTPAQITRAISRARRGLSLDDGEARSLLFARDTQLDELLAVAAELRRQGMESRGLGPIITYSPKVFIPLTRLCRDSCHYCTFVASPAALRSRGESMFLEPDEVLAIARAGADAGCFEALFTLGDRPETRWPAAQEWLDQRGYDSTLAYVRAMSILVLEETGLLPHVNPGVMSWDELAQMRPVAPSMGMMLETTSTRLFQTPGEAHYGSPDKDPAVRLRVLEDAGRLAIPFTTGLLVGIGETPSELIESMRAIRRIARDYGHIQEVIVQNFRSKPETAMARDDDLDGAAYLAAIATTRIVLGPRIRIQAPPNLTDVEELGRLLDAGVDDWGGVSPVTADHVNPERPWPHLDVLEEVTAAAGFNLVPRLTAHPEYVTRPGWSDPHVQPHIAALADLVGLANPDAAPRGMRWQVRDADYQSFAAVQAGGRTNLNAEIDELGRTEDRRGDFDNVYGDWQQVNAAAKRSRQARFTGDVGAGLRLAADNPAALADPGNEALAVALMSAEGEALGQLARIADAVRVDVVGEDVTYVVNRNLNFTNVCYTGCRFCAFAQRKTDADAFTLSPAEIGARVDQAWVAGATEICMQGGIHPDLPGTAYFDLARVVKERQPDIHLHAFSPMEVVNGATRSGMSIREWLVEAKASGLDSIPGTAAEILDDEIRWILTKGKLPTQAWIDVVTTAHDVGLPSSSTMMYGHVDAPIHWVRHLRLLRELQARTGGFTEFVGLPFVHHNAPLYLAGVARPGSTHREDVAVTAMSRLMLHEAIDNIQVSWVKLGPQGCAELLAAGANDLGGTLMEETISRMAGSEFGSSVQPAELVGIAELAGRPARQRTTTYGVVSDESMDKSDQNGAKAPRPGHAAVMLPTPSVFGAQHK